LTPERGLVVAVVLSTSSSLIAVVGRGASAASIRGAIAFALVQALLLVYFAKRGHRWPKWALLVFVSAGLVSSAMSADTVSAIVAPLNAVALAFLLLSWPPRVTSGV
jgi:hypothetical protein